MGVHRWRPGRRRPVAARVAVVAGAAAVGVSVLVGAGAAQPVPLLPELGGAGLPTLVPGPPSARHAAAPAAAGPAAAGPAADPTPQPAGPDLVPGTPCTPTARSCVDVVGRVAWLLGDGRVVRGPVRVQTGGHEDPTPTGTYAVQWKAEQYTSREYLTQMPYSVFFAPGGIAFHEGRQDTPSAGCVKLMHGDAQAWFDYLQIGDEVQVR
ncbi:L,D-transpeptidase [Pseudonocardia hispaniensis]|uniref:L,D-transpeptidase n=1 Tax=Pseudonocardia hispaniensis TaxID=904933 RepID=A0ABW1J2T8_9PSEU